MLTLSLLALLFCTSATLAQSSYYSLVENFVGDQFYCGDKWEWKVFDDPTHGRVNYVDQATAKSKNMTYATSDKFVMRADYTNKVQKDKNPRGRDSIRIETVNAYPDGVIVIGDIAHMPEGCATWPAFWTLSRAGPWPNGGEVDIVEGVNLNTNNLASLHTTPDCAMDPKRVQTGSSVSENCDSRVDYNRGCGTSFSSPKSYGRGFNDCGGGYFVMQKSLQDGVKIWFWSRNDPKIPTEVSDLPAPGRSISTANFGVPSASFPMGDQCDFASHFDPHRIVINLTFCGDWAGSAFDCSKCDGCSGSMSCNDYVDNNPAKFEQAYWEINAIRVFGQN